MGQQVLFLGVGGIIFFSSHLSSYKQENVWQYWQTKIISTVQSNNIGRRIMVKKNGKHSKPLQLNFNVPNEKAEISKQSSQRRLPLFFLCSEDFNQVQNKFKMGDQFLINMVPSSNKSFNINQSYVQLIKELPEKDFQNFSVDHKKHARIDYFDS